MTKAHRIADGVDLENKWSVQAMPLARVIPAQKEDEEDLTLREIIQKTYLEKTEELPASVRYQAEQILSSGAPEKLR